MAILKSKKNDIRSTLKSKIGKMNFEKILENDVISNNIPALLNYSTTPLNQVQKYINNEVKEHNKALNDVVESNINKIISDDVVESIKSFLVAKRNKENKESEIQKLKAKINILNSEDDLIEKCKLEIELSEKEEELRKAKEAFVIAYKEGIEKTLISSELYEMAIEVKYIKNEIREEIEKEIELMKAKIEALRNIFRTSDIVYDMNLMLEDRVNNEVMSERLIEASKEQIPIVQILMK